jgi:hypothetical protein
MRNGAEKEFAVKLAELPGKEASVHSESSGTKSALAGVAVEDVDAQTGFWRAISIFKRLRGPFMDRVQPSLQPSLGH